MKRLRCWDVYVDAPGEHGVCGYSVFVKAHGEHEAWEKAKALVPEVPDFGSCQVSKTSVYAYNLHVEPEDREYSRKPTTAHLNHVQKT